MNEKRSRLLNHVLEVNRNQATAQEDISRENN